MRASATTACAWTRLLDEATSANAREGSKEILTFHTDAKMSMSALTQKIVKGRATILLETSSVVLREQNMIPKKCNAPLPKRELLS